MKKIYFAFLLLAMDVAANAQPINYRRLEARAISRHNGSALAFSDSNMYTWTSLPFGRFDSLRERFAYDYGVGYDNNYMVYERDTQFFTGNNITVRKHWADLASSTPLLERDEKMVYNSNGQLVDHLQMYGTTNDSIRYVYHYNNQYLVAKILSAHYTWMPGWEDMNRDTFIYNSNGQLVEHWFQQWDPGTLQWNDFSRTTNIYNTNSLLLMDSTDLFNNSAWKNNSKTYYTYNTNKQLAERLDSLMQLSGWAANEKHTYSYALNNNGPDTMEIQRHNGLQWEPWRKQEYGYIYNGLQAIVTQTWKSWDINSSSYKMVSNDEQVRSYYQSFTIIDDGGRPTPPLTVYPVPARNMLYVQTNKDNATGAVNLVDMQGRVVYRGILQTQQSVGRAAIDVAGMAPGTYILQVSNGNKRTARPVVIGK